MVPVFPALGPANNFPNAGGAALGINGNAAWDGLEALGLWLDPHDDHANVPAAAQVINVVGANVHNFQVNVRHGMS